MLGQMQEAIACPVTSLFGVRNMIQQIAGNSAIFCATYLLKTELIDFTGKRQRIFAFYLFRLKSPAIESIGYEEHAKRYVSRASANRINHLRIVPFAAGVSPTPVSCLND